MSIQDRITYDSTALVQSLESELDKFNTFQYNNKYKQLLGTKIIERITHWSTLIRSQKNDPLTLVVCGEFKRGKSSFINALLGEDVVTTNVTTETITINTICYGAHSNEIVLDDGKRVMLSDDELKCSNLGSILNELGDKSRNLILKRPLEILKDLTIIDTPGIGDSMEDYSDDVYSALMKADAVVYLFSVAYPISVQEQLFIRSAVLPQKYTDLFLVGNFGDLMESAEDIKRIGEVTQKRLDNILPNEDQIILSALDERCRQLGSDVPNPDTSDILNENFSKFRQQLKELLEDKRSCIIPDRIERLIKRMTADIKENAEAILKGISLSSEGVVEDKKKLDAQKDEFIKKSQKAVESVESASQELKADALIWIDDFVSSMEKDADELNKFNPEDVKKYYTLFCMDSIREAISRCNDYFLAELCDHLDEISEDISKNLSFSSDSAFRNIKISINSKTWTNADNVAFLANQSPLAGIPMVSLAVDYVAGAFRKKTIEESIPDIVAEVKKQYPALKNSALQALTQTFKNLAENAKKDVEAYYQSQSTELDEQYEQMAMVARQDEENKEQTKNALDELFGVINSIESRFAASTV